MLSTSRRPQGGHRHGRQAPQQRIRFRDGFGSRASDLARVPASTISRIESGKIDPTLSMLTRIAEAAGYSLTSTLSESGGDEPFARALRELERVDPDARRRLVSRFPSVAALAPVTRRTAAVRVEVEQGLQKLLSDLEQSGREVVASSLERAGRRDHTHAFLHPRRVGD